jgi:hypothetical protein
MRNSYAKRQPFNCDKTLFFLNSNDGFWHLYDVASRAYIRRLSGPAGDNAEMQWHKHLPNILLYGEPNGGTKLFQLDVNTNQHSVYYDFTNDVRALWPTATHCWSGSEGSPSVDGAKWGFKAEDANFNCLGFFVMNVEKKGILWHQNATHGRPDNVSISPSGRYFIVGGDDLGTYAIPLHGGAAKMLHPGAEHADSFLLPNGHDGWVTIDYQSNDGDMFWIDIDDPQLTRHVFDHAYHNPNYGANYAWHFSGRALKKPGWIVCSNVQEDVNPPPAYNMYVVNVLTGRKYGFAANYARRGNYFDEAHACPSDDLSLVIHNDNYGTSLDIDAYITTMPRLPA